MNNLDRIEEELWTESLDLAPEVNMTPERFLEVVMEVVNAEDEHRISRTNIRQQVRQIVLTAALTEES